MENTEHIWSHVKVEPELPSQSNCLMPSTFPTWKQSPIPFALSLKAHCVQRTLYEVTRQQMLWRSDWWLPKGTRSHKRPLHWPSLCSVPAPTEVPSCSWCHCPPSFSPKYPLAFFSSSEPSWGFRLNQCFLNSYPLVWFQINARFDFKGVSLC